MDLYEYMYEAETAFGVFDSFFDSLNGMLDGAYETLAIILGITSLSISAFTLIVTGITALISFLVSVAIYILYAIPTYNLAKKMNRKWAILAWMPIFKKYFRMYVFSDIAGDKDFTLFGGKIRTKSRHLTFWIYLAVHLFGNTLITAIIAVCNIVPGIGQVVGAMTSVLYLLPTVVCAFMEYAYLRDILDTFKANKKANSTTAIIISVIDALIWGDIAKTIYLYTLLKLDPLPPEEIEYDYKRGSVRIITNGN